MYLWNSKPLPEAESQLALLVQFSSSRDGSAHSGLLVADCLREAGWQVVVVFAHNGPMIDEYRSRGFEIAIVEHRNWLRRAGWLRVFKDIGQELRAARTIMRLLRNRRAELVYVNTMASLAAVVAARLAHVRCIWHLRELFADVGGEMKYPRGARWLVRWALRTLPSRLLANSEAVAGNLLGGKHSQIVTVLHNPVSEQFLADFPKCLARQWRESAGYNESDWLIGIPGTLRPMKGHAFAIRALAPLLRIQPQWKLAITGGGARGLRDELEELVRVAGVTSQTAFLGSIPDMAGFYAACDAICIPSVSEPFGRVVVEAMASGRAVVATRVGGIPEIIEPNTDGFLVEYDDDHALRARINELAAHREVAIRLGRAARAKARAGFSEVQFRARLLPMITPTHGKSVIP